MLFFLRFRPFKASREKSESHGNKLPASTIESPIPDVRLIYVEGVIPLQFFAGFWRPMMGY